MKDPSQAIARAYTALLNNMEVGGKKIKFYNTMAPNGAVPPYLILKSQQTLNESTKTGFGFDHRVTLAAVHRWTGGNIDKQPAENVASAALELLIPAPGVSGLSQQPGFHILSATLMDSPPDLVNSGDSGTDYQKILIIKHLVQQV